MRVNKAFWGCTFGGVHIPCIYSRKRKRSLLLLFTFTVQGTGNLKCWKYGWLEDYLCYRFVQTTVLKTTVVISQTEPFSCTTNVTSASVRSVLGLSIACQSCCNEVRKVTTSVPTHNDFLLFFLSFYFFIFTVCSWLWWYEVSCNLLHPKLNTSIFSKDLTECYVFPPYRNWLIFSMFLQRTDWILHVCIT